MVPSLKRLVTLAVMTEVRTKLIEEVGKINCVNLSFHIGSDGKIFDENMTLLSDLKINLGTIRQHLNKKLDDNSRWIHILDNIYQEVDHYAILLNGGFGEHLWEYHDETLCRCWLDTKSRLVREFASIRQRLFGRL